MERRRMIDEDDIDYVKALISTGTQYINTEQIINNNSIIRANFYIEKFNVNYENYFGLPMNMCGFIRNASNPHQISVLYKDKKETEVSNIFSNLLPPIEINIEININQNYAIVNGNKRTLSPSEEYNFDIFPMYIFAKNHNRAINFVPNMPGSFKLYNFSIEENNNKKIDLYPCLDKEGVACLYDKISKKYFYNSGTGEFEYE